MKLLTFAERARCRMSANTIVSQTPPTQNMTKLCQQSTIQYC